MSEEIKDKTENFSNNWKKGTYKEVICQYLWSERRKGQIDETYWVTVSQQTVSIAWSREIVVSEAPWLRACTLEPQWVGLKPAPLIY